MTPSWFPDLESQHSIKLFVALALPRPSSHAFTLRVLSRAPHPEMGREGLILCHRHIFPSSLYNVLLTTTGNIGLTSANAYIGPKCSRAPAKHGGNCLKD